MGFNGFYFLNFKSSLRKIFETLPNDPQDLTNTKHWWKKNEALFNPPNGKFCKNYDSVPLPSRYRFPVIVTHCHTPLINVALPPFSVYRHLKPHFNRFYWRTEGNAKVTGRQMRHMTCYDRSLCPMSANCVIYHRKVSNFRKIQLSPLLSEK